MAHGEHGPLPVLPPDPAARQVVINALLHPLRRELATALADEGLTLAEMLGDAAPAVHCWVGDVQIPREFWRCVRPKAGAVVTVRVQASGGGGDNNKALRSVLQIAVLAASVYVGGLSIAGASFYGAALSIGGSLAINALIPPQQPQIDPQAGSFNRLRAITGTQNVSNPYGVVPRVYGKHRFFPPRAAAPYTEVVGNDQYLRILLCLGYGPLNVTEVKIGETPIESFQDVSYEVTTTPTLFSTDVFEDPKNVKISPYEVFDYVSKPETREMTLDFLFALGLVAKSATATSYARLRFKLEFRADGTADPWVSVHTLASLVAAGNTQLPIQSAWQAETQQEFDHNNDLWGINAAGELLIQSLRHDAFRTGLRWTFPTVGKWAIRLTHVAREWGTVFKVSNFAQAWTTDFFPRQDSQTDVHLTTIRSVLDTPPVTVAAGFVYLAARIRATDQLSGVVDTINCVAESVLNVWDGAAFVAQATRNPAWVYLDVASGSATQRPLDRNTRFKLQALKDWADECTAEGREYNAVIDAPTTVFELMRDVASVGRASFDLPDGQYSVVRDLAGLTPVQQFTPRNSWGFSGEKAFLDLPHALRVRWVNPDLGWQQDELTVYDDGYTLANATRFELLELRGVTNRTQAWKAGRYHLASARLRNETFRRSVDVENLVCRRGDVVRMADDVISTGLAFGRIKSIAGNVLTLDEDVTMEAGKSYGLRLRKNTGALVVKQILLDVGTVSSVELAVAEAGLTAGDLWVFGLLNQESIACKVARIEAGPDLTAVLTLVPDADGVYTADGGTVPAADLVDDLGGLRRPPTPVIYSVRSDAAVQTSAEIGQRARIQVAFSFPSNRNTPAGTVQGQIRNLGGAWRETTPVPAASGKIDFSDVGLNVVRNTTYELRLRSVLPDGNLFSDWTGVVQHFVPAYVSTPAAQIVYPPDVRSLYINGRVLTWSYLYPAPNNIKGFRIKYHAGINRNWSTANPAHTGLITGSPFEMKSIPDGQLTIMIKAVDFADLESKNTMSLITDLGEQLVANIILTDDYSAAGYPGTITGGAVSGLQLRADSATLFWSVSDSNPFWSGDDTKALWVNVYKELIYQCSYVPDAISFGLDCALTLHPVVTAATWSLEFRQPQEVEFWSGVDSRPLWSGVDSTLLWTMTEVPPWLPWPGQLIKLKRQQYDFRLIAAGGGIRALVDDFVFRIDVPDIIERFNDFATAAGGTRLPITKTYREIKNVKLTLQNVGSTVVGVKVLDKNPTLGPLVRAHTSAGAGVAGNVDAEIQGF